MRLRFGVAKRFIAVSLFLASPHIFNSALLGQSIDVSSIPAANCGSCDGSLDVSLFGFNLPATVVLASVNQPPLQTEISPDGVVSFQGLCSGVYEITASDGTTSLLDFAAVQQSDQILGEFNSLLICSQEEELNLNTALGSGISGGVWYDPQGAVVDPIINLDTSVDGIYTYQMNLAGCETTSGIELTIAQQADPGLTTTYLICENYEPFEMTDLLAGDPDYGGQWYTPDTQPFNGIYDPEVMDTGLFIYQIDTVEGCPAIWTTMYVIENVIPDGGINTTSFICPNALPFDMTDALAGDPDFGGEWTNDSGDIVSNVFDPLINQPGTYYYEVDGLTPCPNITTELVIEFTDGISAGEGVDLAICSDTGDVNLSSQLTGNPTDGGQWYDPQGSPVDPVINSFSASSGAYTYEVIAFGCQPESTDVNINFEALTNAGGDGQQSICITEVQLDLSTLITADADPTGVWLNESGEQVSSMVDLTLGSSNFWYLVEGMLCPADSSYFQILVDQTPPTPVDTTMVFCEDESIFSAESIVPPYSGTTNFWANGQPVDDFDYVPGSSTTILEYTFVSANSCPDQSGQIVLDTEFYPFESGSVIDSLCSSDPATNLDDYLESVDPSVGLWLNESEEQVPPQVNLTSSESFSFIAVQTVNCPAPMIEVQIELVEELQPGIPEDAIYCFNYGVVELNGLLNDESPGGQWLYDGDEVLPELDSYSSTSGTYTYFLEAIGPCPSVQTNVQVVFQQGVDFEAGEDLFACSGEADAQIGQAVNEQASFSWFPENNLSNVAISNPTVSFENTTGQPVTTTYVVSITDEYCQQYDTVSVTVYPLPIFQLEDHVVCEGEIVSYSLNSEGDLYWQPEFLFDNPSSGEQVLQPDTSMTISVTSISGYGCEYADESYILVLDTPSIALPQINYSSCPPLVLDLSEIVEIPEEFQFTWLLDENQFSNESPLVQIDDSGTYLLSLQIISEDMCESTLHLQDEIVAFEQPEAGFVFEQEIVSELFPAVQVEDQSMGAAEWSYSLGGEWVSEEAEPWLEFPAAPAEAIVVCQTVTNEFGCIDSICRTIDIDGEFLLYVPNAFTPDNDGINDVFQPIVYGYDGGLYELAIFNRWGEMLFLSKDPEAVWLGNAFNSGYYVQNDTYIWQIKVAKGDFGDVGVYRGHVTIIR